MCLPVSTQVEQTDGQTSCDSSVGAMYIYTPRANEMNSWLDITQSESSAADGRTSRCQGQLSLPGATC